jgi:hypothetical protein
VSYKTHIDPLVRRQIARWSLPDGVLVDVYLRITERLPQSPTTHLRRDPTLFEDEGMVYGFRLIDPENRLREHHFLFQVFYHADEQTLLVTRGAHISAAGL